MKKKDAFWSAFWQGIAAPALAFAAPAHSQMIESPATSRTDLDAMRGDWMRVGKDFKLVIAREETRITTTSK